MAVHDDLGNRMKDYEARNQYFLQRRTPVAIRVDMKSGHSFTKGFQRPFDEIFVKSMQQTAKFMCENIQGAVLSFQQSDEITIILQDYKNLNTDAWFNYRTDKMCSIAASMATMAFNRAFEKNYFEWKTDNIPSIFDNRIPMNIVALGETYAKALEKGAMFDARVFNIPKEEVANLIYWRQLDATRNSIQMIGQANFSHNELQNKSCNQIQEMLFQERDINWNDFPTHLKRGSCCIKNNTNITYARSYGEEVETGSIQRPHWEIDLEIPIFKEEGRQYINDRILYDDGEPKPVVIF